MIKGRRLRVSQVLGLALLLTAGVAVADGYYKEKPRFHFFPDPNAARYSLKRFGPVGIGLELRHPSFTMHIVNVEKGSPAAAGGELKPGQIIESINGRTMKEVDPRLILADVITEAEATDGIMRMMVKDDAEAEAREVIVTIPVFGPYSDTWPVDCRKSDQIVRNAADRLAEAKDALGPMDGALLFMLSTGEEKDLEVARRWVRKTVEDSDARAEFFTYPWFTGYGGTGFAEYYLRTGDESVLPYIKKHVDYLERTIYNGSWMGRGGAAYSYMGGGHMNAAGVHCLTFLLLAKECGVEVDEHTLQSALRHFFRYAGRGTLSYGDHLPEGGTDNGRNTGLAFAMAAAANLTPEGEDSVYAKARDHNATKGFYATSWVFHGHTGGGIGEYWRGLSMGIVKDRRPLQYRTFMDGRRWMYELARTHDGVFGWVSGDNVSYDNTGLEGRGMANFIPLIYTQPRRNLRIFGAPRSRYSKTHPLPERPWGNAADDVFYSLEPAEYAPGKRQDISKERLETDAGMPIHDRLEHPDVSDETLLRYAHHIEMRDAAARAINLHKRHHLVLPLLQSGDPRVRHAGLTCINGMAKGGRVPDEELTDEMFEAIGAMIENPDESWWVSHAAMQAMSRARPGQVAPHVDRLLAWLDHDDWWLRNAAIGALVPVVADPRFSAAILAKIGEVLRADRRGKTSDALGGLVGRLNAADPDVQALAIGVLAGAYEHYHTRMVEPGGQDLTPNIPLVLEGHARAIVAVPGGYDALHRIASARFPDQAFPHKELFFAADPAQFGPELKKAFVPTILEEMIPEYVEQHRGRLEGELASRSPGAAIAGLVALYRQAGVDAYDWKLHGPARDQIEWDYLTFDPPEEKLWEGGHRFRKVTLPEGAENWFAPEFDPGAAGWKTGRAPFANLDGKLAPIGNCTAPHHFCGCGEPPNTFWDREVLLMRARIKLPPMKDGYAYRLLVGGRSHYDAGGGSDVWINGEYLPHQNRNLATIPAGSGRHSHRPFDVIIDNNVRQHFADGDVLLACTGFLRWGFRSTVIKSYQTFWFEEMKLPGIAEQR